MTLNLEDLDVTSFDVSPAHRIEAQGPATRGCPVGNTTTAYTYCEITCSTCAEGCETHVGAVC
jgi:hypothetical protein